MKLFNQEHNITIFIIPGSNNTQIINLFQDAEINNFTKYEIKNFNNDYITNNINNIRIKKSREIIFLQNPLERLWNIYKDLHNYRVFFPNINDNLFEILKNSFEIFIKFIFDSRNNIDSYELNNLTHFNSYLHILSNNNNYINSEFIILNKVNILDINNIIDLVNLDDNLRSKICNNFNSRLDKEIPEDYMIKYTETMIRMAYVIYFKDFNHFDFKLPKIPLSMINYPLRDSTPVITIITPTLGNPTLIRLKKSLQYESIPYIHLILWDKNRCKNAINPKSLEDKNTFCYEFTHPYHNYPGQRNDVWLRGVGISLTNTPYVTFFDDDTWPDRSHLTKIMNMFRRKKVNYINCYRRIWEDTNLNNNQYLLNKDNDKINNLDLHENLKLIGTDDFEATGEPNKFGYTLFDNSSIYLKLEVARKIMNVFLNNQIYGDDRLTSNIFDKEKGFCLKEVLVNHVSKPSLLHFFKNNISQNIDNL